MPSRKRLFGGLPRIALSLLAILVVALGLAFGLAPSEALAEVPPHSHQDWTEWTDALAVEQYGYDSAKADNCLPMVSGSYYLTKNVSLPENQDGLPVTWEVPIGTTISLCLNGNSITGCNVNWNTATVRGTLNLYDEDDEGILTHTEAPNVWGILVEGPGSTLNMYGGSIKGNFYGVYVASGTLNMYGGNIKDNHSADYVNGSGVVVAGKGTFNMFDGEIANNSAALDGGGVYVMDGNFAMSGGAVTNNAATRTGGGVYVKNGTFTVSGNVSITNNTAADNVASNAYIDQGRTITVTDALDTNARIGVSMKSPDTFTSGWKDKMPDAYPATYFSSDDNKYVVAKDGQGEAMLAMPVGEVSVTGIDAPVATKSLAETAQTTAAEASLEDDGKVSWSPASADGKAAHSTAYTASVTLVPASGYCFLDTTKVTFGKEAAKTTLNDDGTLTASFTFPETEPAPAHKVTVTQTTGGTVEVDKAEAVEGDTVEVTATPAEGYELEAITVDGKKIEGASFAMPAKDVTVSATFRKKSSPGPEPTVAIVLAATGHVQNVGDVDGEASGRGVSVGTTGRSLRLEQFSLALPKDVEGSIEYRGHVQNQGWDEWVADGKPCGIAGQSLRLEAVQMRLTGKVADTHDVWYRVHVQNFGTLGWARGGQAAGTAGQSLRVESLEVQVLPKGEVPADHVEGKASYVGAVSANVHLQNQGWTGASTALEFGTTGQSRRLEAIRLSVPNQPVPGGIEYEVHTQNRGWMPAASDGALAGTTGQSRRMEAVRISLTGEAAQEGNFSVWYRVHSQDHGWLGWAHDGQEAGTTGLSKRAEAIDVQVLPQGQVPRGYDASRAACVTR